MSINDGTLVGQLSRGSHDCEAVMSNNENCMAV